MPLRLLAILALLAPLATLAQEAPPIPPVPLSKDSTPLPNTSPLTIEGDIASQMIEGIDRFLLREIDQTFAKRTDLRRAEILDAASDLAKRRAELGHRLGVRDARAAFDSPEYLSTPNRPSLVGKGENYEIHAIRWPAFGNVHGEGLLLVPTGRERMADVIAIPDSSQTPEQIVGLAEGVAPESQFARRLAETGCRVIVPVIINREMDKKAGLTNREFLYRSAFELGRHLIGYEVQKVLAVVDWLEKEPVKVKRSIGVIGYGDGGMLALYAGALDKRIRVTGVSGYFDDRRDIWRQPIDRNVFGLLNGFSDAEVARLIGGTGRQLVVEIAAGPTLNIRGQTGAPATLGSPMPSVARKEAAFALDIIEALAIEGTFHADPSGDGSGPFGLTRLLERFCTRLFPGSELWPFPAAPTLTAAPVDVKARHARQLDELDRHNQEVLAASAKVRDQFMSRLDTTSLEKHAATVEPYRTTFRDDVIGHFDNPLLPLNPRSRKTHDAEKWTGYEVVLDVFPDVFAYGLLLLPKDLKEGEKRPVVVCQHGLEGRPQNLIGPDGYRSYKAYASQLADRGFIVFAPQNPYIFRDRFRTLQRKANPLGKTLFSIITPQHQQIINFLKTLPSVDGNRIGFYGLSYGGKTAMRVPALLKDYCLSICSADFNEWVWKNASSRDPKYSYVFTGEYEIFEWDLGSTFNYAEMAALIAPRPFMVERGHDDTVAPDEMVAYEYAKVRRMYAKMGIPDRTEIEFFNGPHTINGKGTFDFLHKHLKWPKPN